MAAGKQEIAAMLHDQIGELCARLLPGGKRIGHEWVCGDVGGSEGKSLHVELRGDRCGFWNDLALNEGGDVFTLIQRTQNTDFTGAMDWARDFLGLRPWTPDNAERPAFDPLKYSFKGRYGSACWTYRNEAGEIIAWVVRFQDGENKDIIPMRMIDGSPKWKGWTKEEKKPIYNLDKLVSRSDAPLLIVEGEKTADAASKLFSHMVAITWQGGSAAVARADWSRIISRNTEIYLWPDADDAGRKAMMYLKTLLPKAHLVSTESLPQGWDLADVVPEGVDLRAMLDAARYRTEQQGAAAMPVTVLPSPPKPESVFEIISRMVDDTARQIYITPGMGRLDEHFAMGPSQVTVIGARPATGKTAFALNISANMAMMGHRVMFLSLEMSATDLVARIASMLTGVNSERITRNEISEHERTVIAAAAVDNGKWLPRLIIHDLPTLSCADAPDVFRSAVQEHHCDVLVLDYLQLVSSSANGRYEKMTEASIALKAATKAAGIRSILLSQLKRREGNDVDPTMDDLRESGQIEADADTIILLGRAMGTPDLTASIVKNKKGPVGFVRLYYDLPSQKITGA